MLFTVTGINFKTAPIEIRELLSFHKEEISEAYKLLLAKEEVYETVILSTCNRVEIYAIIKDGHENIIKEFIRDYHKYSNELDKLVYKNHGIDAVRHLCIVASGLDSMVLGEPQIFGQVKEAFAEAQKNGAVKHAFDYLFTQVFSLVKKVRTKTHIGEKNVSVSYAVVKLASQIYPQLNNKRVMILGAGEMGELTVRNLLDSGVTGVIVANRTFQRAVALAEKFNGTPIMIHEILEYINKVDIIISSITTAEYIITRSNLIELSEKDRKKTYFIVDISVPRSIDPEISIMENVHLYNVDDLQEVVNSNSEARKREAQKGYEIIESRVGHIIDHLRSCDIIPTLISIRNKAEEIRKDGILKTSDELKISEIEKEMIDNMTKTMVNKILYHSEVKLREYSNTINFHKKDI